MVVPIDGQIETNSQLLVNALLGNLGTGPQMDGFLTNQDLDVQNGCRLCRMDAHSWSDVFLVVEEDQFFARSKSGTIRGTIYFQIGDSQFFPGKGWTDMVAAFVAAWLEALIRVTDGTVANQRVHFFDGPFAVDFSVQQKGQVNLAFLHNQESKLSTMVEVQQLRAHAASVGQELLLACQRRGWNDRDTGAVANLIQQM